MAISKFRSLVYKLGFVTSNKETTKEVKEKTYDFDLIEYYHINHLDENATRISDKTIHDIDLHEVFKHIDKTLSHPGQQFLFTQFLTQSNTRDFKEQEVWINHLLKQKETRKQLSSYLTALNKREDYYIANLFLDEYVSKPRWFWIVKLLATLPAIFAILSIFSKVFLLPLTASILINLALHYYNKRNIYIYKDSIPQLLTLLKSVKGILSLDLPELTDESIQAAVKSLDKHKSKMALFKIGRWEDSDMLMILYLIIEYLKIIFLLEPLMVFSLLSHLQNKRKDIQILFEFIGKLDAYHSVLTLREETSVFCIPQAFDELKSLSFTGVYHPLIKGCIANDLHLNGKSVLLTGSNMAGKTTFIRTVAVNVLVAQTINTCFAEEFNYCPMRIFSNIRISDDLLNDRSYYFEEVLSIQEMIHESTREQCNLFLLDEIFKGTNTIERIAAGKAILSYLNQSKKNLVLVSTHDVELAELLKGSYDLYHFSEIVKDGYIYFDYKLKKGQLTTRNAIRILELNEYPAEVIVEARKIAEHIKPTNSSQGGSITEA